jgi:rhodanese-related sulfurtransferase
MKTTRIVTLAMILTVAAIACTSGDEYTSTETLRGLIEEQSEPYVLVDVRTPMEYASGYIPTAINIPHTQIGGQPPTEDKDALIILYCRSGSRSSYAERVLESQGYSNVTNFGGILQWQGPVEKP